MYVAFGLFSAAFATLSRLLARVGPPLVLSVKICHLAHATLSHAVMIVNLVCLSTQAAAGRRPASFALGGFEPASGWTPGWSFFIGLLPVSHHLLRHAKRVHRSVGRCCLARYVALSFHMLYSSSHLPSLHVRCDRYE